MKRHVLGSKGKQGQSATTKASNVQQPVKVITGAPVVQQTAMAASPFTANLASAQQFPSLGNPKLAAVADQLQFQSVQLRFPWVST